MALAMYVPKTLLALALSRCAAFLILWSLAQAEVRAWAGKAGSLSDLCTKGLDGFERHFERFETWMGNLVHPRQETLRSNLKDLLDYASRRFAELAAAYNAEGHAGPVEIRELDGVVHGIVLNSVGDREAQHYLSDTGLLTFDGRPTIGEVRSIVEGRTQRIDRLIEKIDTLEVGKHFDARSWRERIDEIPLISRAGG